VIGPYRIEERVGGGSFGSVFRARDLALDREVALKILRPGSPAPAAALLAEARAAAALSHVNVCAVYAVDSSLGAPMIVMEYVAGRSLSRLLEEGPLPREQAAALGRQIAQGMAAAHAEGVVHGDLKPANVLVTPAGTVKIVDFGLARRGVLGPSYAQAQGDDTVLWDLSQAGGISGTPAYMAPEQARGEPATPASDIFSLGVMLYEMVTGQPAREEGNLLELLLRIEREDLTSRVHEMPAPFGELLRLALAVAPAERRITMACIAELLG